MSKIFRIFTSNAMIICAEEDLYRNTSEGGLYHKISLLNHGCLPNATTSWVMGDFQRTQVRAVMVIEKDEEILLSYRDRSESRYSSREFRRQELLEIFGFHCECSECSLQGEDLEENERMREEIREKGEEIEQLMRREGSEPVPRRNMKKVMKLAQRRVKLIEKLNIRAGIAAEMINFYALAVLARRMNISCENEPEIYKQEAFKYAEMFGDCGIHFYNRFFAN